MQTIILPGYSEHNKAWAEECAGQITVSGIVRPVFWEHWTDKNEKFKAKEKALVISKHTKGDEIFLICKSIGTLVGIYIINDIPEQIKKVILCGIPLMDLSEKDVKFISKIVLKYKDKIKIFQNDADPHGAYEELRELLPGSIEIVKKERSSHDYPYYTDFNEFLLKV